MRYTDWRDQDLPSDSLGTETGTAVKFEPKQGLVGDTITLNSSTVLDLRAAYTRYETHTVPENAGADQTTFGLPASYNMESDRGDPSPCITGTYDLQTFCNTNLDLTINAVNNNYDLSGNVTRIIGSHTIEAGASIRRMEFNIVHVNYGSGFFNFDTGFTSSSTGGGGNSLATFLLGYPTRAGGSAQTGVQQNAYTGAEQLYQGYFATDTWHTTSRLTLAYGVRWEIPTYWEERNNSIDVFLPQTTSPLASGFTDPITSSPIPLNGTLALVDSTAYPSKRDMQTHYDLFAPRVGATFRVFPKTVLRSGYGIFYLPAGVALGASPYNFSVNSAISSPPFTTGSSPITSMDNPIPDGIQLPGGHSQTFLNSLLGKAVTAAVPDQSYPYTQQWNVAVQQQIGGDASLQAAYVGSSGVHLLESRQMNTLADKYLKEAAGQVANGQAATIAQTVNNPFAALIPGAPATITYGQLLLPYPQYLGMTNPQNNAYHSSYNGLQAEFQMRFASSGTLLAAYTWSKMISNADSVANYLESNGADNNGGVFQDPANPRGERSISAGDVPQILVVSYTLNLPFGAKRRFLANLGPVAGRFVGGWDVNGITTFESGFPLTITTATVPSQLQPFNITTVRPNLVAGCQRANQTSRYERVISGQWFNTACYSTPAPYTFGDEPRVDSTLKQDGERNFDFALAKDTPLTDHVGTEFRVESFNLFNTPQFGPPATRFGSATFGNVTTQTNNQRLLQFALRLLF